LSRLWSLFLNSSYFPEVFPYVGLIKPLRFRRSPLPLLFSSSPPSPLPRSARRMGLEFLFLPWNLSAPFLLITTSSKMMRRRSLQRLKLPPVLGRSAIQTIPPPSTGGIDPEEAPSPRVPRFGFLTKRVPRPSPLHRGPDVCLRGLRWGFFFPRTIAKPAVAPLRYPHPGNVSKRFLPEDQGKE